MMVATRMMTIYVDVDDNDDDDDDAEIQQLMMLEMGPTFQRQKSEKVRSKEA